MGIANILRMITKTTQYRKECFWLGTILKKIPCADAQKTSWGIRFEYYTSAAFWN